MKKFLLAVILLGTICSAKLFSQSMNCSTATQIPLTAGAACVNGTNVGAITDNTMYGACNATPVDVVWYTYVTNGSNNSYTLTPGTLQNAELIIYTGSCPLGGQLQNCVTAAGSTPIVTTWGMTAGIQVWIGIASTTLNDGTFNFCVNSQPPVVGAGNLCSTAIPICNTPFNQATIPSNSSGQSPTCFGSAPQQDIFIQFTITQSGVLAWTATCPPATEYDWCLWDISAGCPGTIACCNYNYAAGSGLGFGMQNSGGNAPCGTNALGADPQEFSPTINVTCGKVYAIQISNYSNNNNGFNLSFTNSTCLISSNAAFTCAPTFTCGASLTTVINNTSTGACGEVWDYGDGSATYSGTTPPNHTYNTPGTYAITATIAGSCPSTATQFVQLLAPLAATATVTPSGCAGCTGTAGVSSVSGGDGIYTYSWMPGGATTSAIANLCAGVYTVTVSNAKCGSSVVQTVTVTSAGATTITVNSATICNGANTTLTANGGTTYTWTPATGLSSTSGASVTANPTTTTVYTVTGSNGACVGAATSTVTVSPNPTVTVNSGTTCNGGSIVLTANGATTYAWSPPIGLSATTGASVTANPPSTTVYTITGTSATCTSTATATVTVVTNPTVTVNTATICLGQQTATLTANGATTYAWSPAIGLSSTVGTSVTANPGATTVYTITGTAGTCTAVTTTTVTVNPLPVVIIGSNSPVCVNQTLNLTSGGGTSYSWNGPNIFSSVQQNPSIAGVSLAATGVYTVTVTDANSCVNSSTTNVQINPLPIVAVTGATVCLGATINLTANGGTAYSWSGPLGYSSNSQNPSITNATAAMAGNYVVVVTDANGCTNGSTAVVAVNSSLVIVAGSNSPICQNATLNLTASSGVSWTWSGPLAYASNQQNPTLNNAQPNVSGTYTVTGTDANGCQGTATTNVTVNPLPTITATSATICIGNSATINAGGATTYTWNTGVTGGSLTSSPASTTSYTVVGTDNNGCVNFATTSITVNPLPIVTVNSGVICIGNNTVLTANGAINYSWNPIVGLSSGVGSPVTANPITTTSYTVTGTDVNTCTNTAVGVVIVNPLPTINVSSASICAGSSTTLNATGANSYNWTPTAGLSSGSGASVTANPAATSAYTVTGTDVNGCQNFTTLTVTVNNAPLVTIGPQTTSGCAPVCVTFTNTASGTGTCVWNFGNGANSASCNPNYCFTAQGSYQITLTLTDNNGCLSTSTASVTVYPVPNADFNVTPQPTTILDNAIHFYDVSSGANIATWNWNLGNGTLSTTQNPTCLYGDTGSYAVSLLVISDMGCRDSITKIIKIDEDFMIFVPNAFSPNSDGTNDVFMAKGEGVKNFKMWIFDRWGMQIFFSDDIYKGWDGRFLSKGTDVVQEDVYVWKIECKNMKGEPKMLKGTVSLLK